MKDLENRPFNELQIGESAEIQRVLTSEDIQLFAILSGDMNPAHLDDNYAKSDRFHHVVGHGMWLGSLVSSLLGTQLPGPGTIYLNQSLQFCHPVSIGDCVTIRVSVKEKNAANQHVTLDCTAHNQEDTIVLQGQAVVIAPTEKIHCPRVFLPEVRLNYQREHLQKLTASASSLNPVLTAVVHPVTKEALEGAVAAAQAQLIIPILVGPREKIRNAASANNIDISAYELIATEHSHAAASTAVSLARQGKVGLLMKGSLHTDELLQAVLDKECGLRTARRLSHVFVMDVPSYPRLLLITDAVINIEPNLEAKRDIVQNVIDFAQALGIAQPKIAILSAVETVNAKLQSTLDAAALCKMADRGQITGAILDGPLAFDNAISKQAALVKGINSPVAGLADILVVPDLVSGNMLAKQLEYMASAHAAGVVLGARIPIILSSRADQASDRSLSALFAVLYHAKLHGLN